MEKTLIPNKTSGFWGEQTATINWCEINYEVTYYIAEFWNTISNLVMILFPIYGIYWSYVHTQYAFDVETKENFKTRFFKIPYSVLFSHLGLMVVGLGSWMFHMTLLYPMQLLDEIPMVFGSGIIIYANYDLILCSFKLDEQQKRSNRINKSEPWTIKAFLWKIFESRLAVALILVVYCVIFVYVYLYVWNNPIFHEMAYGIMVFVVVFVNFYNIHRYKLSKKLYVLSLLYYTLGFLLWNIDNNFCDYLVKYRKSIEEFLGIAKVDFDMFDSKAIALNVVAVSLKSISEFHSLWHVFTGYASYMSILALTELQYQHFIYKTKSGHLMSVRPVSSKYFDLYFHLTEDLIDETNRSKVK